MKWLCARPGQLPARPCLGSHDPNVKHIGGSLVAMLQLFAPKPKKRIGDHLDDIADRRPDIGDPGPYVYE